MSTEYNNIVRYIDAHIKSNITVDDIASAIGYSAGHVHKLFRVYSPYPMMEYIRRKKLYFALSDMYGGQKLYDIALDYGYETPAGFYKAFKSVFGCAPSDYKNMQKAGTHMMIDQVKNLMELDETLNFCQTLYPNHPIFYADDNEKYSRNFWIQEWEKHPELMLLAKDAGQISGAILGWVEGEWVTVAADGVAPGYENKGIHETLFVEMEKRAKQLGYQGLVLGILEGKEAFYATMGYIGKTLIQSEKYSADELKIFLTRHFDYEITGSGVYDGYVNQLWVDVPLMDKKLRAMFAEDIGDCWVQVIVSKAF